MPTLRIVSQSIINLSCDNGTSTSTYRISSKRSLASINSFSFLGYWIDKADSFARVIASKTTPPANRLAWQVPRPLKGTQRPGFYSLETPVSPRLLNETGINLGAAVMLAVLCVLMWPGASTVLHKWTPVSFESQEGNRCPGLYSSIL